MPNHPRETPPSARTRSSASLVDGDEWVRLLVESVPDYAIFLLDPAGRVLTWTPAAPLAPGAYDVSVDHVQRDIGGDSVPMRQPYRFSFTAS